MMFEQILDFPAPPPRSAGLFYLKTPHYGARFYPLSRFSYPLLRFQRK